MMKVVRLTTKIKKSQFCQHGYASNLEINKLELKPKRMSALHVLEYFYVFSQSMR